ncbi:hypothetical protein OQA88_9696 [Cercophora sp. LCS_1]
MSRFFKPNFPSLNRKQSRRSIFKEEFDPDQSIFDNRGPAAEFGLGAMPTSPTPRDVRRLASNHEFVLGALRVPRRLGLWPFIATHMSLIAAFVVGIISAIVAIVYTSLTGKQPLQCPLWAIDCGRTDDWTIENLGTIQGVITLLYFIGVSSLAFVALAFCEAAIWPLLTKQSFTIRGLEVYLATTRGSVLSAPAAAMSIKSTAAGFIYAAAVTVILVPLASLPLVGHAFTPVAESVLLGGQLSRAGGIDELYAQTDPPTSVVAGVLAKYHSWSANPSSEPMPEYRDWYIDRETLAQRGGFSAKAVKLDTSISCTPYQTQQVSREGLWWNAFLTNMTRTNNNSSDPGNKNSSAEIFVRNVPQLTLWADSFDFVTPHQTRTRLVFAALNGSIEGGAQSPYFSTNVSGASAIACEVDMSAHDSILTVGHSASSSELATLSSLATLKTSPSALEGTVLNELLLWFTISPLLASPSVDGTQPMFANSTATNRAIPYTTSSSERNIWSTPGIEDMIRLSIGALAQTTASHLTSGVAHGSPEVLVSYATVKKLDPSRALLLLLLPLLVLVVIVAVGFWSTYIHKKEGIPVMRLMGIGEVLKSAQTGYLRAKAGTDAAKTYLPNELGSVVVRYGVDKDGIAGLARGVRDFREEAPARVEFI